MSFSGIEEAAPKANAAYDTREPEKLSSAI